MVKQKPQNSPDRRFTPEQYARLKAESQAPYRGLRKFVYIAFGASGFIGAMVFLAQLAAGNSDRSQFANLALQVGIVTLMVFLFRWDREPDKRS